MSLVAGRRRGPSGLSSAQGFSLVGLIVTLTIVVTLSGVATIYYQSVVDDQQIAIAANELDEYSKAIRAYMLKTRRNLNPAALTPFDDLYAGGVGDIPDDGYTLDFLVDEGLYREINRDPWGHIYRLDPNSATVYSLGPDPSDPSDDIIRPYSRGSGQLSGQSGENPIPEDDIPPVISGIQPVGVIKVQDPVVRASFYDHFGGTIDQASVKMFIDQVDLAGDSGLTTDSAGQILYTTGGGFSEGVHTVVVQVADTNGNLARREWTFTVDTNPAFVEIHEPVQGEALRGVFNAEIEAFDDTLKKVTVRLDFGDVSDRFLGLAPPDSDAVWTNAIPPNNGGGSRYRGVWGPINTTLSPPNGIEDGTHFFTLLAEDYSGRVISTQSQFIVDNTSPTIDLTVGVDPFAQPPTGPTSPQVLATTVAHFETRGLDNIRVKEIRYWFRDVGNNLVGTRGTLAVTGPEIMVPIDWLGDPAGDWAALYNSADEVASTTAASAASYTPLTLPEGEFRFEAWAVDLAGNESSKVSTNFIINLSAAGVTSLVLFDQPLGTNPVGNMDIASQTISGMEYTDWNSWSNGSFGPVTVQTTGHLRYQLLRTEPASFITASIDDYTTSPVPAPGRDGVYHTPTVGNPLGDWEYGQAALPASTGTQVVGWNPGYSVHRDQMGPKVAAQAIDRRGGAAAPFPGGKLEAKVFVEYGLSGQTRSAFTTFYVDTEYPIIDASNSFMVELPGVGNYQELSLVGNTVTQLTQASSPPEIRFGGFIEDRLCKSPVVCDQSKARLVYLWGRRFPLGSEPLLQDPNGWVQLWPHAASQPETPIATFGAPATQAGAGPMNLTSPDPSQIDGQYAFQFKAVDGAGHTTAWQRDILVNAVGPLVDFIRIENAFSPAPAPMVPAVAQATTSTIQEPFLELSIQVTDEVDLDRIEYRITKIGPVPPFGSTIIPVPPGNPTYSVNNILIFQDQLGSVFRPSPTSYKLEVWGVSAGKQGIFAETRLEFQFLTDLAVYAPNYNSGTEVAMRADEQKQIADYLYSNVDNVQSKSIYDHAGKVADTGGVSDTDIDAWMSARQSDGQTDVLVILDAADKVAMTDNNVADNPWTKLKDFLSSADHNVVVFSGGVTPGPSVHNGVNADADYADNANDDRLRDNWVAAIGIKDANREHNMHADRAGADNQVPTPLAQMLLPSLSSYRNEDLMGANSDWAFITSGRRDTLDEDGAEGLTWTKINLTEDRQAGSREMLSDKNDFRDSHTPDSTSASGAAFLLEESGGGVFANFYSYGHRHLGQAGTQLRKAAVVTGPVIEEFIEQYLVGLAKPDAIGSKVAFTAKKNSHAVDPAYPVILSSEVDVYTWPFVDGGTDYFGLLTNANQNDGRAGAAVMDMTPDGGAYLVFAIEQEEADFPAAVKGPIYGYLLRSDSSRVPLYRNTFPDQATSPTWGRMSEDGRRAVILGAGAQDLPTFSVPVFNGPAAGNAAPSGMVAWLYDLTSAQGPEDAQAITTNAAAGAEGTIRADVSGDGNHVVLISDTKMHTVDSSSANRWSGHAAMPVGQRSLAVYDVGSDSYTLINDDSAQASGGGGAIPPTGECASFFANVVPQEAVISYDGSVVVWVGLGSGGCLGDQTQILISKFISGTWHTGKITDCPSGTNCENGTQGFHGLDIADVGGDVPQVIFSSKGNFRDLNVSGSVAVPQSATGADPTSGGGGGPSTPPNVEDQFEPAAGSTHAEDTFEGGVYTSGSGWGAGWDEQNDNGLVASGVIKLGATACAGSGALILDGAQDASAPPATCGNGKICDDLESGGLSGGDPETGPNPHWTTDWTRLNSTYNYVQNGGGAGPCRDDEHLLLYQVVNGHFTRGIDVSSMNSPVVEFDFQQVDTSTSETFEMEYRVGAGAWTATVPAATWTNDIACGPQGPYAIPNSATEIRFHAPSSSFQTADYQYIDNIEIYDSAPSGGGSTGCQPGDICDDFEDGYSGGHSAEWSGNWSAGGSVTWTQPTASGCGDGTVLRGTGPATNTAEAFRQFPDISGMSDPHLNFTGRVVCGSGDCARKHLGIIDANSGPGGWNWVQTLVDNGDCYQYSIPIRTSARYIYFRAANGGVAINRAQADWGGSDYFEVDNVQVIDGPGTGGGLLAEDYFETHSSCASGSGWDNNWTFSDDSSCTNTGNKIYIRTSGTGVSNCAAGDHIYNPTSQAAAGDIHFSRDVTLPDIDVAGGEKLFLMMSVGYDDGSNNDSNDGVDIRWNGSSQYVTSNGCTQYELDITAQENSSGIELRIGGRNDNENDDTFSIDNIRIERRTPPQTLGGGGGGGGPATCGNGKVCDDWESGDFSGGTPTSGPNPYWTGASWTKGSSPSYQTVQNGGGAAPCRDDQHLRINYMYTDEWVTRTIDLSSMNSPEITFDFQQVDGGSADTFAVRYYDGSWNDIVTFTDDQSCASRGPYSIPNDATEIRFTVQNNFDSGDYQYIDNIEIYDSNPPAPPGPPTINSSSPYIERMFTTEVTGAQLRFTREYTGMIAADTGYQIDVTTDNGSSWSELITFPNANNAACYTNPGVALPAGSDGIRIGPAAGASANTTGTDTLKIDDLEAQILGNPYGDGTVEWTGDWTEGNDDDPAHGSPTNGDAYAGLIQGGVVNACDATFGVEFRPPADFDPAAGVYLEREVDLSAFTAPQLEYQRVIGGSAFNDPNERFDIRAEIAANIGNPGAQLRRYQDIDNTEGGLTRTCTTETYPIPTNSTNTMIRFEYAESGSGGTYAAADDWILLDNIVIRDAAGACGSVICDDFEDLDTDGDLYNNGSGWSGRWSETGTGEGGGAPGDSTGTDMYVANGSGSDCQDGNYLTVNSRFDSDNIEIARDWNSGTFATLNNPALVFNAQLACPAGDCNEQWLLEIKDSSGNWQWAFFYSQGSGDYPSNTFPNNPMGCQKYVVPIPSGSQGFRIRDYGGGWDAAASSGPDNLYLDNFKVLDLPDGCGSGQICDDFDHGNFDANDDDDTGDGGDGTGGSGWSGPWSNDETSRVYEASNGTNPCRENDKSMLIHNKIEGGEGVRRSFDVSALPSMSGATGYILSFWHEADTPQGGDTMKVRVSNSGGYLSPDPLYSISGSSGCRLRQVYIPDSAPTEIEFWWDSNNENSSSTWIDNIVIRRDDAGLGGGGGGGPGLHPQVGLYIWTGSFGSSGNQFFRVVDPQDGPAENPRISPDGRTFVFETTADQVHGVMGFDSYDSDPDSRVVPQVFDFDENSTIAGSGSWGANDRKIFRGRFQKMSNSIFGYSSVLQLVAPLSRQGSSGNLLELGTLFSSGASSAVWDGYTLPVSGN